MQLNVYYDLELHDVEHSDALADQAAGLPHVSCGDTYGGRRKLVYLFNTDADLQAAKTRLLEAGFRFVL